jgi:excinuclease ABC subunit C
MIDLSTLPQSPGCYRFRNRDGTIIYIGKARNLRKRVTSYFSKRGHDPKTAAMVALIDSLDFIVTGSDTEAYLLESNLIKVHQPKYNIDLRDSKRYAYIRLSDEEFPRLSISRRAAGEGSFFGPFVSAAERDHVLAAVKKVFRLRTCKRITRRSCLRYHMGSCSAPCRGKVTPEEYRGQVREAEAVLKGRSAELIAELREEMRNLSDRQEFEKALRVRDRIAAIEHLVTRQHVEREKRYDQDVIHFAAAGGEVHLMVFRFWRGKLVEKEEFTFGFSEDFFEEFILQYYGENKIPEEIVLPQEIDPALEEALASGAGKTVRITVPQRGEKRQLLDLVRKNIDTTVFGEAAKAEDLGKALGLPAVPHVIECFDISHLSGTSMVGAMVRFRDGSPDKKHYRRFRIKTVEGIDDFRSIAEVVRRRYGRLKDEEEYLPDLVVIDGGKGQLDAALGALREVDAGIPVIALAKREEDVYVPGGILPVKLDRKSTALKYLQEIRDEAHRFAVAYNRLLRRKKAVG